MEYHRAQGSFEESQQDMECHSQMSEHQSADLAL